MYRKHFKPSKKQAKQFAETMDTIRDYCAEHNISHSISCDSYYFTVNGIFYRVSNHTIENSNKHAFNDLGEQVREKYHSDKRDPETVYITASKTRLIEIHTALLQGKKLNKRGYII